MAAGISGTVRELVSRAPVWGAAVYADSFDANSTGDSSTDTQGCYLIEPLESGTYDVVVVPDSMSRARATGVSVGQDGIVRVDLDVVALGALSGIALSRSGRPAAGIEVVAEQVDAPNWGEGRSARTGPSGVFAISGIEAWCDQSCSGTDYDWIAWGCGMTWSGRSVRVRPDEVADLGNVVMDPAGQISLRLLDNVTGDPIPDAEVYAYGGDNYILDSASGTTDADGWVQLRDLSGDMTYGVVAQPSGHCLLDTALAVRPGATTTATVRLDPSGDIGGTVMYSADQLPAVGWWVCATTWMGAGPIRTGQTDATGKFLLQDLNPSGTWRLEFYDACGDYSQALENIVVESGRQTDVTLYV